RAAPGDPLRGSPPSQEPPIRRFLFSLLAQREPDGKGRPLPVLGIDLDPATVPLHNPVGDREPQPKASSLAAGSRFFRTVEPLEDMRQVFRRDAGSGIAADDTGLSADLIQAQEDFAAVW